MKSQQPDDEEECSPRPSGEESTTRGEQGLANENAVAAVLQPLTEVQVLHQAEVLVAAQLPEDGGADEDPLIAVIVLRETVTNAVDVGDQTQAGRRFGEQVLERTAHDTRIGQGVIDQAQRIARRLGVQIGRASWRGRATRAGAGARWGQM